MASEGHVPGSEGAGSGNRVYRRNSKRVAERQPRDNDNDGDGVDDQGRDQFRLVKRPREKAPTEGLSIGVSDTSTAAVEDVQEIQRNEGNVAERQSQAGRIRASPGRMVRLNKACTPLQKSYLAGKLFGGLLNLADTLPAELTKYLVQCYQTESSEMVFPGRGRIRVDADSVHRVFALPNRVQRMRYFADKDSIKRFRETFNITSNSHPQVNEWIKGIKQMGGRADDTFFMAWLAVAFSTFLAPTTSLNLSPRCYGVVLEPEMLENTNICLFVAEHINEAFRNMSKDKQNVCCCLYHLMILYLDALVVDEHVSSCAIRANAWDSNLIAKVIKKDLISPGVFGKLQLKEEYRGTEQTPLLGRLLQAEAFVASKLPQNYNPQKRKMMSELVHGLCKSVVGQLGNFIESFAKIDEGEPDDVPTTQPEKEIPTSRRGTRKTRASASRANVEARSVEEEEFEEEESEEGDGDDEVEEEEEEEQEEQHEEEEEEEEDTEEDGDGRNNNADDSDEESDGEGQAEKQADNNDREGEEGVGKCDDEERGQDGEEDSGDNRDNHDGGGAFGGDSDSNNDDDDDAPGCDSSGGNKANEADNTESSSSGSLDEGTTLNWWMDKYCRKDVAPDPKKKVEAAPVESINMFELCNLKPAFLGMLPVPSFAHEKMFEKTDSAIDYQLFLQSLAEKNEVMLQEVAKGLDFLGSKSMYKKTLDSLPDLGHASLTAGSKRKPPSPPCASTGAEAHKRKKTVILKKNLELPKPKQCFSGEDAGKTDGNKSSTIAHMVPTAVPFVPTGVHIQLPSSEQEPATEVEGTTFKGTDVTKGKMPVTTHVPKLPKQNKVVKFAKGTKGEELTENVAKIAIKLGTTSIEDPKHPPIVTETAMPRTDILLPTAEPRMPMLDEYVPTATSTVSVLSPEASTATPEDIVASAVYKVPTSQGSSPQGIVVAQVQIPRDKALLSSNSTSHIANQQSQVLRGTVHNINNTLTQEQVFNIVSKCMPPRPPPTILARTKSAGDAENVSQGTHMSRQVLRRSSSASYHGDGICDASLFDLGIDNISEPIVVGVGVPQEAHLTPPKEQSPSIDKLDDWDSATTTEACNAADRVGVVKGKGNVQDDESPTNFHTPIAAQVSVGTSNSTPTSSGPPVPRRQRRVIRPGALQRSPFIDYNKCKSFNSTEAMNKLYAAMLYWVRNIPGADDMLTSPEIVNYDGFYISLKELVDSMKPKQWLSSMVVEIGIIHTLKNLPEGSKKVIMPLRVASKLQQGIYNVSDINTRFGKQNRLDKKDMVMVPVLECDDPNHVEGGRHYWLFNINLRDQRFEVLDSSRTLEDVELMDCASTIAGAVRNLWRKHYPSFSIDHYEIIDIDVPKQLGNNECGLFMELNACDWNGSKLPNYDPTQVLNIRKFLAYQWVTSDHNSAPWRKLVKYEKE